MNTNKLKTFAQRTRKKLLQQVEERLDYVLNTDSAELREQKAQVEALKKEVKRTGREALIDKVAYTWFNRLVALRYMDVNDYQPFHVRVISPQDGFTEPQILSDAKQGIIPDEFKVDRSKINQLLDGTLESQNPQNEVFKLLLVAACNNLHSIFPFLFEPIADYSELLLPADLISEHSVIHDVVEGMTAEDCKQVEILGWLYQFYISEKKDEVFASKGKVKKEEIPAATQLFTPRWIVEYMVQNTVGKLWVLNHPNSRLKEHMEYYIESEVTAEDVLTIDKPEELTLLDQACGSGHILVYGFELLYKIYEEEGYAPSDIPRLIIEHNLHGFEIDERAAQLAGLAILMKAREHQRRLFRTSDVPEPKITCFEDLTLSDEEIKNTLKSTGVEVSDELLHDLQKMRQATNFGSLIVPYASVEEIPKAKEACEKAMGSADLFEKEKLDQLLIALDTLVKLGIKFCCVVDNPPYMGSAKMNKDLSQYVGSNYSDSKSDLMAVFIEVGINALKDNGLLGIINKDNWMFLNRYEDKKSKLRSKLINDSTFISALHLGPRTFPEISGEVVQNVCFVLLPNKLDKHTIFFRLVDFSSSEEKRQAFLNAINKASPTNVYKFKSDIFEKIPGKPFGYWLSDSLINEFENPRLESVGKVRQGFQTGDNPRFVRNWYEVDTGNSIYEAESKEAVFKSGKKYVPYNKGGQFKKWYGNNDYVVKFDKKNYEVLLESGNKLPSRDLYFKKGITWTDVSTGSLSARISPKGFTFSATGACTFPPSKKYDQIIGFMNTKVCNEYLKVLAPSLHFTVGDIKNLPISSKFEPEFCEHELKESCKIAKNEYDTRETSWDFKQNELIRFNKEGGIETLEEAYDHYKQFWQNKFYQLHQNEEELNRQFIEIYGLEEELTPDVPLEEITILQEELDRKKLVTGDQWTVTGDQSQSTNHQPPTLPFKDKEVMAQFVSYAVGCMFGRYSLDKEGLILANQGETLEDYLEKIELSEDEATFLPDESNIIPVLEDNWFEDDITGLFYQFLRASFGERNFEKNLAFIEEKLGHDIRTWFTRHFYNDHVRRYNKRPIYWQFSSENGVFKALIYMHRYTPNTPNKMLNGYLRDFKSKLNYRKSHLQEVITTSQDSGEVNKAEKELRKTETMLEELEHYERNVLMPLATDRIEIDLDDGVLVNYNKFGQAVEEVKSLNDPKKKKAVKEFDWIDGEEIR